MKANERNRLKYEGEKGQFRIKETFLPPIVIDEDYSIAFIHTLRYD